MTWYLEVLKKYAVFTGRARRKEYWFFVLFNMIIATVLLVVDYFIGTFGQMGLGLLYTIYMLAVVVPSLAVAVRRLHDTNRTGWWLLVAFVPFIGALVLLVFLLQNSQAETNQYGPNPKAPEVAQV